MDLRSCDAGNAVGEKMETIGWVLRSGVLLKR